MLGIGNAADLSTGHADRFSEAEKPLATSARTWAAKLILCARASRSIRRNRSFSKEMAIRGLQRLESNVPLRSIPIFLLISGTPSTAGERTSLGNGPDASPLTGSAPGHPISLHLGSRGEKRRVFETALFREKQVNANAAQQDASHH